MTAETVVGVGTDLCEVERLRTAMTRTPRLRDRVFAAGEQAYCERRGDPGERYAARFALKEAVLKALGVGLGACALREIEVVNRPSGAPDLVLHGAAARLAAERGISGWRISLTHTGGLAQAIAVALGPGPGPEAAAAPGEPGAAPGPVPGPVPGPAPGSTGPA